MQGGIPLGSPDRCGLPMANDTHTHRPSSPRALPVAALGCCVLASVCVPAAAAHLDLWPTPAAADKTGVATGHLRPTPAAAKAGALPANEHRQGSGSGEQSNHGHHEQGGSGDERQGIGNGGQPGSGNRERQGVGPEQPGPGNREQRGSGNEQQGAGDERPGAGNRRQRGSGRDQQGSGNPEPQDRGHHEQKAPGGPRQASPSVAATAASTAVSAPLATAPALASSTTTTPTAASPQVGGAAPTVAGRPHRAARRHGAGRRAARRSRRARGLVASRGVASAALSLAGAALGTAIPVTSAHAGRTRAASPRPRTHSRPSPLVTTITRIVGVVPTPLRVLLGVLLALAVALGVRSRLVALRARRLERQREELLEDVGLLQAALLPVPPARLGPVGISAAYRPAAGPAAGGDFYDVFALDDGPLAVIVGDVSGHGRQALPHTALVRFTLRAYLEAGLSPRSAVQTAGAVLERQLGDSFVTVVAATYQPRDRILIYACAGHPPPLVLGARSLAPITLSSSPPIGVGMRTGVRQTVVSLPGRSHVCFHTDGVTDARVGVERFGEERLARALAELGPPATASALLGRVAEEADARPDDMAACLLRVEGCADAPTVLVEELELDRDEAASDRTERFLLACGVGRDEIPDLMLSAHAAAARAGTVLLELRFAGGSPEVALRRDNVTPLDAPSAIRRASLGVFP
jgi:serine phosphatase RsbU (regulator of sigma subunit)